MSTAEERISFVEGQVNELSERLSDVRADLVDVRAAIRGLDERMERKFSALDDKVSRQFLWLVGIQVTTLAAVVVALIPRG